MLITKAGKLERPGENSGGICAGGPEPSNRNVRGPSLVGTQRCGVRQRPSTLTRLARRPANVHLDSRTPQRGVPTRTDRSLFCIVQFRDEIPPSLTFRIGEENAQNSN